MVMSVVIDRLAAAQQLVERRVVQLAPQVVDGDLHRRLGAGVLLHRALDQVGDAVEVGDLLADQARRDVVADRLDDRAVGIAGDHRGGRRLAIADVAGVGVDHHHDVLDLLDGAQGSLERVFSGTRSMPKRMSVIFMDDLHFVARGHPDDVGDAVDVVVVLAEAQRDQRRQRHAIERPLQCAVGAEVTAAVGVVDHPGMPSMRPSDHHHVAGDVDQVADCSASTAAMRVARGVSVPRMDAVEGRADRLVAGVARQLDAHAAVDLGHEAAAVAAVVRMPPAVAFAEELEGLADQVGGGQRQVVGGAVGIARQQGGREGERPSRRAPASRGHDA
jgi:hypothetical protein